ncbi:small ribosomal subunit protein mS33 isoform X1 [Hydra vulgaris]|uniref:Small ribosomal subunit protein mS33 n=1 Tax=Hydra vulgaris TaxID=6087 RepID=T2M2L9_HYDVU|nr:28S ribosomal protein S33, mitochondrial [Hydra vulgaris]
MIAYARRMAILSAKIFGHLPRPVSERSQKVIDYFKSQPLGVMYGDYYPPMKRYNSLLRKLRFLGIYHDEHMDFNEEMAHKRKVRGKGPPKKGEGKRSKKKK